MTEDISSDSEQVEQEVNSLAPFKSESLLMEWCRELSAVESALVISPGRAQTAELLVEQGAKQVQAWYLDLFAATQTAMSCRSEIDVVCAADLPEQSYDLFAMPVLKRGEAELTRDLLQQAHERLLVGGTFVVSVDNPRDNWLHEQMQMLFKKVTAIRQSDGCVYVAKKDSELRKKKDFRCQFSFRSEEGEILQVVSRPGVFSHRRLDGGARQLILSAEVGPHDNVLDMGCGAGAVALSAAKHTDGSVYGVDCNARAVECLAEGADLNGLTNIKPLLNADGQLDLNGSIDVALANPPYYGNDAISSHFVETCYSVLRPGGAMLVVTKKPTWYEQRFGGWLEDIAIFEASKYYVACGRKSG